MKASFIRSFGTPDVLAFGDVDLPEVGADQVCIRVLACGINHYDIFLRRGDVTRDLSMPHVMGADVVGEIEACGAEARGLPVGQRVIVAPGYPLKAGDYDAIPLNLGRSYTVTGAVQWGGYAERMLAPARFVHPAPPEGPPEELATLPLVLTTATHAVKTLAGVQAGQHVLVQAGASGSGAMSIQVAKALGAKVAATVGSAEKFAFVKSIGADLVINYTETSFLDAVKEWTAGRGVDAVIDNVGGSVFEANIRALTRGGHFVNFGMVGGAVGKLNFPLMFYKQIHLHGSMMGSPEELDWGMRQVEAGRIRPILDRTLPLAGAAAAHRELEARRVQGKIVLLP